MKKSLFCILLAMALLLGTVSVSANSVARQPESSITLSHNLCVLKVGQTQRITIVSVDMNEAMGVPPGGAPPEERWELTNSSVCVMTLSGGPVASDFNENGPKLNQVADITAVSVGTTQLVVTRIAPNCEATATCTIQVVEDERPAPETPTDTSTDVTATDLGNDVTEIYTGTSYIYKYTAVSALHILRAAVGKEEGSINRKYDVNADGEINAVDALWALQSAVGKRVVEWPLDKAFPE